MIKARDIDFALISHALKFPGLIVRKVANENIVLCGVSGKLEKLLLVNEQMLNLNRILQQINYKQRWMVNDYFVLSKLLQENREIMGLLPESLVVDKPTLKIIQSYKNIGKISAITWPGSYGIELIQYLGSSS